MITTAMMMTTSAHSDSPWIMPVTAEMTAATMSMMTMGSAICWKKRIHSGVFSSSLSLFGPNFAWRVCASEVLRPASALVDCSLSTSSAEARYSFKLYPSWYV